MCNCGIDGTSVERISINCMLLLSPGVANCFWVIQNKKLKVYEAWRVVERLALRDRHRRPTGFRLGRKSCSNRDAWW